MAEPPRHLVGALPPDELIGRIVGNHVIEARSGATPVASVYRARHATLGRPASILVFSRRRSSECHRRVLHAAATASRIRHPNFVEVYEASELADGRCFVVREWLEGCTLGDEMARRGRFSEAETLDVIEDVASALAAVHAAGEAHGNLHPASIILVPAGGFWTVKLIDFGAGRPHQTSAYCAPELASGAVGDARSDIYSLGVLLHQMLTGALPSPPRPISPSVDAVLESCLAGAAAERIADLSAVMSRLRQALSPPTLRPAAAVMRGLALRVELRLESSGPDDLVALTDALALARASCVALDLEIAREQPNALIAVLPLEDGVSAAYERLVGAALVLGDQLLDEAPPSLRVKLLLHAGTLVRRARGDDAFEYVGGDLLSVGSWPSAPVDGVLVTRAAAWSPPDGFAFDAVAGEPDVLRVSRCRV